jgi:hypothetical protein
MMLLIAAVLLFVALVAVAFLEVKRKLEVLAACVVLLIVCNFVNEIRAVNGPSSSDLQQIQK